MNNADPADDRPECATCGCRKFNGPECDNCGDRLHECVTCKEWVQNPLDSFDRCEECHEGCNECGEDIKRYGTCLGCQEGSDMDPTANVREQLNIVDRIQAGNAHTGDAERLADLVQALHEWMKQGGALPAQWVRE